MTSDHPFEPPYFKYRHRCVADLAWCIFSPSLIRDKAAIHDCYQPLWNDEASLFFDRLDKQPQPLQQWLATSSSRLGFVYERFWQFWWTQRRSSLDWQFNIQIHNGGKTLGEVDALSYDPVSGELNHYELAVKFYLGLPPDVFQEGREQKYEWVGPQTIDRLHRKWRQMDQQQLNTCRAHAEKLMLPDRHQLKTHSVTRGRLFTPYFDSAPMEYAQYIATDHLKAKWLSLERWRDMKQSKWRLLERSEWFAPLCGKDDDLLNNRQARDALEQHFQRFKQPIQIIGVGPFNYSTGWIETERLFVVPEGWPEVLARSLFKQ